MSIENFFIEATRLGILEVTLRTMTNDSTKRKRKQEFERVCRVLRDLMIVSKEIKITGVAYGVRSDGELGLFVVGETIKVQGQVATA